MKGLLRRALAWASNKIDGRDSETENLTRIQSPRTFYQCGQQFPQLHTSTERELCILAKGHPGGHESATGARYYGTGFDIEPADLPGPEGVAGAIARSRNPSSIEREWARYNKQFCSVGWTHVSRMAAGENYKEATHRARRVLPPPPPGAPPRPRGLTDGEHLICDDCADWAKRKGGWALQLLPAVSKTTDLGTDYAGLLGTAESVENTTPEGSD